MHSRRRLPGRAGSGVRKPHRPSRSIADKDASVLLPFADDIASGLTKPEAQTRWEVLHALDQMGKAGQRYDEDVLVAAEDSPLRRDQRIRARGGLPLFCGYGSASTDNLEGGRTQIDEAIQCYHGNPEFTDMPHAARRLCRGKHLACHELRALAQRMKFDSENASGTLRMRSEQIVAAHKNVSNGEEVPQRDKCRRSTFVSFAADASVFCTCTGCKSSTSASLLA